MIVKLGLRLCCFLLLFSLSGCLASVVGLSAAGVGLTKSSYDQIISRSYTFPYWAVYRAAHNSFEELHIRKTHVKAQKTGDIIYGETEEYQIQIELCRVTDVITRVTCRAGNTVFTQDTATAAAITEYIDTSLAKFFPPQAVTP
ncbi:MAG: DUF3568 family protein [Desulfovibrionales bacterium]|nr:DUF3568 family protein [Desulfovibrionales bacterium]